MIHVTCAILLDGGKVLLAQNRASSDHPFQWEFPGGKIKPGESAESCIVREIMEELNLKIKIEGALRPVEHEYSIKTVRLIPFICTIISGTMELNNHQDTKWVSLNKLMNYDLAEADRRLILLKANWISLKKYIGK
ncbi:MAG TPA: (deoxy)nucleoside triphosphate pyrophosphohydrolase [Draconibacterium sp.]|nr:(deoxy)nucleoside triphosphate pyrophosphohydrolase [Draconibacterium sp.]